MTIQADEFLRKTRLKKRKTGAKTSTTKSVFIGVHIRRSDYESYLQSRTTHGGFYLSKAYYWAGFTYFYKKFNLKKYDLIFVLASDDQTWVQDNFRGPDFAYTSSPELNSHPQQVFLDMAILSRCNHSIISYGTYSFWTAYLKPRGVHLHVAHDYDNYPMETQYLQSKNVEWVELKDPCVSKNSDGSWKFNFDKVNCTR